MDILKKRLLQIVPFLCFALCLACNTKNDTVVRDMNTNKSAEEILGKPNHLAISYGGYRGKSREQQPTIAQLKDDIRILATMDVKILRTYNTHLAQASNLLKAIAELKAEDPNFEMYVMLGAWINCEGAFTANPNHDKEDVEENTAEIDRAVKMAQQYPDIVKIIAVGNEAMVKWATSYYVQPGVILKWVNHLQNLKKNGELPKDLWITSSDNFASWGGGEDLYHVEDLNKLIKAVDYISMHTYPMHDTHYNPTFWGVLPEETQLTQKEQIEKVMTRSMDYVKNQYKSVSEYMKGLGVDKPVHIGETGWASFSNGLYGDSGSKACDQYKEGLYYKKMRAWTNTENIACFYFEAFDEPWKDAGNAGGSENHFGIFNVEGEAKYAIWDLVDAGTFEGLTRDGNPVTKSFDGDLEDLLDHVLLPAVKEELALVN